MKEEDKEEKETSEDVEMEDKKEDKEETKKEEEEAPKDDDKKEEEEAPKDDKKEEEADKDDDKKEEGADKDDDKKEEEADKEDDKKEEDGDVKMDDKEEEEEEDASPKKAFTTPTNGKRERKTTAIYDGGNFKDSSKSPKHSISAGRGTKLKDIPLVKASIDKTQTKDPILPVAYKLLFYGSGDGRRGAIGKKMLKKDILEFSGYLPKGEKNEEEDDELESKFGAKAFKLTIPLLKTLCDLFAIDRTSSAKVMDKETMVNLLLDFLSAPDAKLTSTSKSPKKRGRGRPPKNSPTPKKARKASKSKSPKKSKDEEETEDEEDDINGEKETVEEIDGKTAPTKKELRKFVRAYITCFSMDKTTTKHLLQTASDKFNVDMSKKKADILEILTAEMPSE